MTAPDFATEARNIAYREVKRMALAIAIEQALIAAEASGRRAGRAEAAEIVDAARAYRQAETDGTPRMWRGKDLQDLANALDEALAAFDAILSASTTPLEEGKTVDG